MEIMFIVMNIYKCLCKTFKYQKDVYKEKNINKNE
jgi:hypothetical protein